MGDGSPAAAGANAEVLFFTFLMNLWVYPLLAGWTLLGLLLAPAAWLLWKLAAGWSTPRIIRHFIWIYGRGWMVIVSPFVRFEVDGFAGVPAGPVVYVINHLSFFDTYCMAAQPQSDIVFAVRAWPFRRLFWYTTFMRLARYLDVENEGFEASLPAARAAIKDGASLLFFPEGHRSRDGRLQRFYSGAFLLALKLELPLVPLCITGTDVLLPPGRFFLRPTTIRLKALPAFDSSAYAETDGHRRLRKDVKAAMSVELGEPLASFAD